MREREKTKKRITAVLCASIGRLKVLTVKNYDKKAHPFRESMV